MRPSALLLPFCLLCLACLSACSGESSGPAQTSQAEQRAPAPADVPAHTHTDAAGTTAAGTAAAATGPAAADTVVFAHARGHTTLPRNPQRVVVFDLATLDMLAALGVDAVVGVPAFKMPAHLAAYEGEAVAKVGSLFEPDYEAIGALQPQVIFVGRRSEARLPELNHLAPTVDMAVDESRPLESIYANLRQLGALFGKQAQAEDLIAQSQAEIAALRHIAPHAGSAMLLLVSGGRINSYGPGSRMGMIFDAFGLQSAQATGGSERHGQSVSFEYILQTNPDWLLVLDRDTAIGREGAAAQRLFDNALIQATRAGQKGQIVFLDATNWYVLDGAGITALRRNVQQLHQVLSRQAQGG